MSVPSRTGHGREVLYADPGWDAIPGSDGSERAIVDRLLERAGRLSDGIREVVLRELLAAGVDLSGLGPSPA